MLTKLRLPYFFASALALGGLAPIAACGGGGSGDTFDTADSSLVVDNQSDFAIVELHLAPVNSRTWGPNLLAGDALYPDEQLTLGASCGTYDALLVDDSGVDCEVDDLDLCLNDAVWIIRNNTCNVFGARATETASQQVQPQSAQPNG